MKSEYVKNFDGIRASEKSKQKAIYALISYINETRVSGAAKKEKQIIFNTQRIIAVASTVAVLIFCAILIPALMLGPYSGSKEKSIKDYYEEYNFKLPFKHSAGNNQHSTLYFKTGLTMEQMCESINSAGFIATIHDYDNKKRIFITATQNEFSYYFVIFDKIYVDGEYENGYVLSDCSASIILHRNTNTWERYQYIFLFPTHLSNTATNDPNTIKIYSSFEEFAEFYRATGKNDAQINYENMTVVFFCRDSADDNIDRGWIRGNVVMQYIKDHNGNHINVQAQSN